MVNRGKFFLTFFVVASILCCSGCGATTDETVKIGAIGPLTGDSAIGGIYEQVGREMVIDEVNEAGGVLGKRIELIVEDDASQPVSYTHLDVYKRQLYAYNLSQVSYKD